MWFASPGKSFDVVPNAAFSIAVLAAWVEFGIFAATSDLSRSDRNRDGLRDDLENIARAKTAANIAIKPSDACHMSVPLNGLCLRPYLWPSRMLKRMQSGTPHLG
jgi:hypothetical protein